MADPASIPILPIAQRTTGEDIGHGGVSIGAHNTETPGLYFT
jgi:hypothetical protein